LASFPFVISFSVQGVRTFNGDGTGTVVGRVVSLSHPFALPTNPAFFNRGGATSGDFEFTFDYEVAPDLTFTVNPVTVTVTFDSGTRDGQTLTITNLPPFVGRMSKDHRTLSLHHGEPRVETATFVNAQNVQVDRWQRICHRSRILLEQKGGH
jgi:hypothetical protein